MNPHNPRIITRRKPQPRRPQRPVSAWTVALAIARGCLLAWALWAHKPKPIPTLRASVEVQDIPEPRVHTNGALTF